MAWSKERSIVQVLTSPFTPNAAFTSPSEADTSKSLHEKDVDVEVALIREGVDADVALGDDYEPGDSPVVGNLAGVGVDLWCGDLGHANHVGVLVEKAEDERLVAEFGGVGPVAVDGEMQSSLVVNRWKT